MVAPPSGVEHVFIVSIDGGKPAVMRQSRMPTLFGLVRTGAATMSAQTVFPSITLVSHTSMLTGVGPAKHKILWNEWLPERGTLQVPTAFGLARLRNKRTTALFAGKEKFIHLNLPGTLDTFSIPSYKARDVAAVAARHIEVAKPNLCFVHFADPDGAGHRDGWGTESQKRAFADTDAALRTLLDGINRAGIAKSSVVLVTADHGGHAKTHGTDSPEDMTIPWIAHGAGVRSGFTISAPVTTYDTAATALWLLGVPIPPDWDGKPVTSAFIAAAPPPQQQR
jgi:predicted AlkP superfamily pyrophosphatase or phosphodiesterase